MCVCVYIKLGIAGDYTGHCVRLYLIGHGEDELVVTMCHQALQEVPAAGCQHGTVGAELLALHLHGDIAEQTALTLLVQAQQEIGAVHRRLIHVHRALRLLIHGHTAHTLHETDREKEMSACYSIGMALGRRFNHTVIYSPWSTRIAGMLLFRS